MDSAVCDRRKSTELGWKIEEYGMAFGQPPFPAVEGLEETHNDERLQPTVEMDTSSVRPAEQFGFFRSWYAGVFAIELIQEELHSFSAHQIVWNLGKLMLTHLEVPSVRLGWRHLSKPTIDNWYLHVPLRKSQPPADNLEAGDLFLRSFRDPSGGIFEGSDHLILRMPHDLHFIQSSRIELRENSKRLLADYLLLLHRSLPDLRRADVPYVAAATTSMLAACLMPSRDHIAEAQRPIELVIMNRVSQIIAKNLADPALTPNLLCSEIGMSRSGLYRVFESVGAFRPISAVLVSARHVTRWWTTRTSGRYPPLPNNGVS